jgi:hypothetical protein
VLRVIVQHPRISSQRNLRGMFALDSCHVDLTPTGDIVFDFTSHSFIPVSQDPAHGCVHDSLRTVFVNQFDMVAGY